MWSGRDVLHPGDIHTAWHKPRAPLRHGIDWRRRAGHLPVMNFRMAIGKLQAGGPVMITGRNVIIPRVVERITVGFDWRWVTRHVCAKIAPVNNILPLVNENKGIGRARRGTQKTGPN